MLEKNIVITTDQTYIRQRMDDVVTSPLMKSFMAGAISGTCSTVLFQPLDLIKTRLQKSNNLGAKLGMFAEIANVVRQEKILGLWTGLVPSLLRCVPGIGLYFTSLHWLKSSFGSEVPHPLESVMMGASARTIAGIMVLPFTVLKTRYESGEFHYKSLSDGIRSTYAKEGFRALYSGLAPTLLRDVPFSGLYLMFYTQMKVLTAVFLSASPIVRVGTRLDISTTIHVELTRCSGTPGAYICWNESLASSFWELTTQHSETNCQKIENSAPYINFTNGLMAGSLASFVTQPADVIKTNMQLYPKKYGRLKNVIMLVYTERGFVGFWRGIVPRLLRRTLMSASAWTVYEEVMRSYNIRT